MGNIILFCVKNETFGLILVSEKSSSNLSLWGGKLKFQIIFLAANMKYLNARYDHLCLIGWEGFLSKAMEDWLEREKVWHVVIWSREAPEQTQRDFLKPSTPCCFLKGFVDTLINNCPEIISQFQRWIHSKVGKFMTLSTIFSMLFQKNLF